MGNHRKDHEPAKARVAVAGALTAGALLIAPVVVTLGAPAGTASAATPEEPGGGGTDPTPPGGGTDGANPAQKRIIRLPFVKIEIKNTRGDRKPPKIKVVPFPRLRPTAPPPPGDSCPGASGGGSCGTGGPGSD